MKQHRIWIVLLCTAVASSAAAAQDHIECEHTGPSMMFPPLEGSLFANAGELAAALRNATVTSASASTGYSVAKLKAGNRAPQICVDTLFPKGRIKRISVLYELEDGRFYRRPLRQEADAVFLSASAVEKFVVPYYSRGAGVDSAGVRRDLLQKATPPKKP
jgi:hypothetical protein